MNLKSKSLATLAIAWSLAIAAAPASARPWHHHGHYHGGGIGAGIAGFAAGALIGGALAGSRGYYAPPAYAGPPPAYYAPPPGPPDARAYCASRFRSYDPASGTYLGYDGMRHPCP
jgi:hypothetical protein